MDSAKQTSRHSGYEKSKPISIPGKNTGAHIPDEYSLKQNFFDPNKSSPASWNARLQNRLTYFADNKSCSEITA
jgi:hypothetical protein